MKASAMCPGSCGELIQGIIGEKELLVSYAINRYSRVTLIETDNDFHRQGPVKARKALQLAYEHMGIPVHRSHKIYIDMQRELPVGKGMASSTADIGSVIAAASSLSGIELNEEAICRIALKIEPTDSILFKELTLFDPVGGSVKETLGCLPTMKVIVLEGRGTVDTQEFRKNNYIPEKMRHRKRMNEALQALRAGIMLGDCERIGKAAVTSALCNQGVLKKENLELIADKVMGWGASGINVAHSGTVIGILVSPKKADPEEIMDRVKSDDIARNVERVYCLDIIQGGAIKL
jgi:L-threonine kinase